MNQRFEFEWEAATSYGRFSGNITAYGRTEAEARADAAEKVWRQRFPDHRTNPVRILRMW